MSRVLSFFLGLAALLAVTPLHAELMIHPTRIVFEGRQRSAQLDLINRGAEAGVFRLLMVNRRMTDTGDFLPVDQPLEGEQFAESLVRYSPRQITLAPGESQAVRLLLRKPADLASGEYRSHLLFQRLPVVDAPTSGAGSGAPPEQGIDIRLTPVVSVSVPVIVRHGETSAAVTIEDGKLDLVDGAPPVLAFTLRRSGNQSVYGDVLAYFTPPSGTARLVGKGGGVAVYAPNALRHARLPIRLPSGEALHGGTLRLVYQSRPEAGARTLAEAPIPLR